VSKAWIVAGLGFGDEGKGSVVDWLARRHGATTVVRYNGGAQAAHHVVTPGGRTHCFAQFGAASFVPGVRTHLSRFMVVDPLALAAEAHALGLPDAYARLSADPACVVVTPFHRLLNRIREAARGDARHGSCGLGIAEARLDSERPGLPVVRLGDALDPARLRRTLRLLWHVKVDQAEQIPGADPDLLADLRRPDRVEALVSAFADVVRRFRLTDAPDLGDRVVFEGAQGVLLDREHGFWPHVTPSDTTFRQALALLDGAWETERVGVLRAYHTRHGAGPLPTEDEALTRAVPDAHNGEHPWQGRFRLGWFDGVLARYALRVVGGVDTLVVTNLDRLAARMARVASTYEQMADLAAGDRDATTRALFAARPRYTECAAASLPDAIAHVAGRRVDVVSLGPTADDKRTA
jgi:adenylosuccinate synthase